MEHEKSLGTILRILEVLSKSRRPLSIKLIKEKGDMQYPISPHLLWLQEMGFVKRIVDPDTEHPLFGAKWEITPEGKKFLRFVKLNTKAFRGMEGPIKPFSLVLVYPKSRQIIQEECLQQLSILGIYFPDLLKELFGVAKDEILIASPYIEQVILPFFDDVSEGVTIRILTNQSSPLLERLSKKENIEIFILHEKKGSRQIYQLHSKFICVDGKYCIVGSMNLNERSMYYNFETGIFIQDSALGSRLRSLFDTMIKLAMPLNSF